MSKHRLYNRKIKVVVPPDNDRSNPLTYNQYITWRKSCKDSTQEIDLEAIAKNKEEHDRVEIELTGGYSCLVVYYEDSKDKLKNEYLGDLFFNAIASKIVNKENFRKIQPYGSAKTCKRVYSCKGKRGEIADVRVREEILKIDNFFFPMKKKYLDSFTLLVGCHKDKQLGTPGTKPYLLAKVRLIYRDEPDRVRFETHDKCIIDTKKQTIHKTKNGVKDEKVHFENEAEFWESLANHNISS
jgi:hypothetical protein